MRLPKYFFTTINLLLILLTLLTIVEAKGPEYAWTAKLDSRIKFYQTTELGALLIGTEKSLYAVESESGEVLWRRRNTRVDETDLAPVVGTDMLLLCLDKGDKSRVEAVDIFSGATIWQSDKLRGNVMQLAVEPEQELLALVLAQDTRDKPQAGFKRKPTLYLLNLKDGNELWKYKLESDIEMMPLVRGETDDDVNFTLDNYRAPLFLDGRLYLFYEGVTSFDARSGRSRIREKFKVNEDGLALTEAEPIFDEQYLYISGRGKVRAVSRASGEIIWEAKDLGLTPELTLIDNILYVRTGGRFIHLKDGETVERGPYGVSAIDAGNGKVLWRYKGADRGITNIALLDRNNLMIADRDELILLDSENGKRKLKLDHKLEKAAFMIINEAGNAVVGGQNELAAFKLTNEKIDNIWRVRCNPPGRGVFRIITAVAARAASLYFRYGGTVNSVFEGVQLARSRNLLRWSGLAGHVTVPNLTDMATGWAREYTTVRIKPFGLLAKVDSGRRRFTALSSTSIDVDVTDRLIDRIDPAKQLERLSRALLHKERLAALRGDYMYFYTELKNVDGRGLAGINVNNGRIEREIKVDELDRRFDVDETLNVMFIAKGDRLAAITTRR